MCVCARACCLHIAAWRTLARGVCVRARARARVCSVYNASLSLCVSLCYIYVDWSSYLATRCRRRRRRRHRRHRRRRQCRWRRCVSHFSLSRSVRAKLSSPVGQAIKAAASKPHLVIAMNTIPRKTGDEYASAQYSYASSFLCVRARHHRYIDRGRYLTRTLDSLKGQINGASSPRTDVLVFDPKGNEAANGPCLLCPI